MWCVWSSGSWLLYIFVMVGLKDELDTEFCLVFYDALFAYCSTADLHQMISTTEFIGARAFLFHTDRREGGHLYGDVLMMDLGTLRQDIKRNILYPCGVNVERKDGSAAMVRNSGIMPPLKNMVNMMIATKKPLPYKSFLESG